MKILSKIPWATIAVGVAITMGTMYVVKWVKAKNLPGASLLP
jgi:hypothetical protein